MEPLKVFEMRGLESRAIYVALEDSLGKDSVIWAGEIPRGENRPPAVVAIFFKNESLILLDGTRNQLRIYNKLNDEILETIRNAVKDALIARILLRYSDELSSLFEEESVEIERELYAALEKAIEGRMNKIMVERGAT